MTNQKRLIVKKSASKRSVLKQVVIPACLGSMLMLSSCQLEQTKEPTVDNHKHILGVEFTNADSGIWPPQALNATNVVGVRNYASGIKSQTLAAGVVLKERFERDATLQNIRGNRYASFEIEIINEEEVVGKDSEDVYARTTYYNYDSNLTIDAWIDGNDTIQYSVQAGYETQPPENREEEANAVALAKTALLSQGFSDAATLKGTAMLAFPNETYVERTGQYFYADRILYATFGQGDGEVPVYSALVNLSKNTVSDSGKIATY